TSFDPLAVDAVNRRSRGIFLSRESLPLAAGSKNVNNSVKCKTKWSGFTPSSPRLLFWSKNRSNQTPQIVRNMPNCIHRGLGGHSFPPVLKSPEESLCLQDPSVISRIGSKHTWHVYCLDKSSGKIVWDKISAEGVPKIKRHIKSTHASSTPATDGRHVVAFFGSEGLFCYDVNGKLLWKQDLGVLDAGWFYDPD